MCRLIPLLLMLAMSSLAAAQAAQNDLRPGDVAPALDIAHWMKGDATTRFEPGHVYVLEFWATWCGPCVGNMEHLSKVQERYSKNGVTVIGVSDEPLPKTVSFLCSPVGDDGRLQNDRTRYTLATDPDRSVYQDYMTASGRRSLPTVFLIGRKGQIEWIGHPRDMDDVLEAVVDGSWQREEFMERNKPAHDADRAEREANARFVRAHDAEDWEAAIAAIDELIAMDRGELSIPIKYAILLSTMKLDERAAAYARKVRDMAWDDNPWLLYQLAWTTIGTRRHPVAPERRDLEFALETITRAAQLDPHDRQIFELTATIRAQRGEPALAIEAQRRAIIIFEAVRPKLRTHEVEGYESELQQMRDRLKLLGAGE